jgi:hypothetical protein
MPVETALTSLHLYKHPQAAGSGNATVERQPSMPCSSAKSRAHVKGKQRGPVTPPPVSGPSTTRLTGSRASNLALHEPFDSLASSASDGPLGVKAADAFNRSECAKAREPHLPLRLTLNSTDTHNPKFLGTELYSSILSSLQRSLQCDHASVDSHPSSQPSSFADAIPPPHSAVATQGIALRRLQRSVDAGSFGRTDVLPVHTFLPAMKVSPFAPASDWFWPVEH